MNKLLFLTKVIFFVFYQKATQILTFKFYLEQLFFTNGHFAKMRLKIKILDFDQ